MIVDVLINSCARPDSMELCFQSFLKMVKTKHQFRFVLVEDKVDSEERQCLGRTWIQDNEHHFDEIVFLDKKAGFGYHFQEVVKRGKSPFFFRLEDDQQFVQEVDIDPLIRILEKQADTCQIILRRDSHRVEAIKKENIDGVKLVASTFYSDSIGVHNLELTKKIIDECGWDTQLHENSVLTPASKKLGIKKYVLDYEDYFWQKKPIHYVHAGKDFRRGSWKI